MSRGCIEIEDWVVVGIETGVRATIPFPPLYLITILKRLG